MRSGLTRSIVVAVVVAAACEAAVALPVGGAGAEAVAPVVHRVAHQPKEWTWHGGWWRYSPWSDHAVQGLMTTPPGPVFFPWGAERLRYCAARYRSYDPATGTYVASSGERRICR